MSRGNFERLAFAAGALVLALAGYWIWRPPEDAELRIREALERTAKAAEERDLGGVLEIISEQYRGPGGDKRDLSRYLFAVLRQDAWRKVVLAKTSVSVDGTEADVETTAVLVAGEGFTSLEELEPARASVYEFSLKMVEEDGDWRVVAAKYKRAGLEQLKP